MSDYRNALVERVEKAMLASATPGAGDGSVSPQLFGAALGALASALAELSDRIKLLEGNHE